MLDPFTLALIGAGTGALLDNDKPLRGAAIGGTLGYGGGTLLGAGGVGGSTSPFSVGAGANGIGTNFMAGGDVGRGLVMNASMAAPSLSASAPSASYVAGGNPAAFLAPTGQEVGMANAFNMTTGAPTDLAMQTYGAENAMLGNPMLGGVNPLSDANYTQIANSVPEGGMFDSMNPYIDKIKPYFNVQNLQGASMIANQFKPQPMPSSSGGRITQGQAPAPALGGNIQTLLAKMPERKRISLLV